MRKLRTKILQHWARMERVARDKHSSLLQTFVNYDRKSLIIFGPGSTTLPQSEASLDWSQEP
jgi:hypothetical protein